METYSIVKKNLSSLVPTCYAIELPPVIRLNYLWCTDKGKEIEQYPCNSSTSFQGERFHRIKFDPMVFIVQKKVIWAVWHHLEINQVNLPTCSISRCNNRLMP